jgi:hypothetical protein
MVNASGATVPVSRTVDIEKQAGQAKTIYFNVAENGTINDGSGIGGGGGIALDSLGAFFQSLFVPSQGAVDSLKASFASLASWGPFNLFSQLVTLNDNLSTNHQNPFTMTMPVMNSTGEIVPGGSAGQAVLGLPAAWTEEGSAFSIVRKLLGFAVYVTFAYGLASRFMPKPTT